MALRKLGFMYTLIKELHCLREGDEGEEFFGATSIEPYLWVAGFRIDGERMRHTTVNEGGQTKHYLRGQVDFWFNQGSHGNLGDRGVETGDKIQPRGMTWHTTLSAIPVNILGRALDIPGIVGMLVVLMEEGNVPDGAAEAGHQRLNEVVSKGIQEFVESIELGEVALIAARRAAEATGKPLDQLTEQEVAGAAIQVVEERFGELQKALEGRAESAVEETIKAALSVPQMLTSWLNPDEAVASGVAILSQQQFLALPRSGPRFVDDEHQIVETVARHHVTLDLDGKPMTVGTPGTLDYHVVQKPRFTATVAFNWHDMFTIPDTREPSGDRVRIECATVEYSQSLRSKVLMRVGGRENGRRWLLRRWEVYDHITSGRKSFYVRGPSGIEAEVVADIHDITGHEYIRTEPDGVADNNLWSLPRCYDLGLSDL